MQLNPWDIALLLVVSVQATAHHRGGGVGEGTAAW